MHRGFPALVCMLSLTGCSYIPWFAGDEDPRPPTPLEEFDSQIVVTTLWSTRVGEGTDERRLNLVPALDGTRLYVADAQGLVVAVNSGNGQTLWERDTGLPLSGGPAVGTRHLVLGSSDGDLLALSKSDGTPLWNARLDSEVLSVPRIAESLVLVHTLDDSVHALDLTTGDPLWKYNYPAPVLTLRGSSSPLILEHSAIVGISGGRLVKLELASGLPLWEITVTPPRGRSELARIADIDADPIVIGDVVYVSTYNGDLAAIDLNSGSVLWRRQLSAHAGLAASTEALYITDSDDIVWAATVEDGTGTWKQETLRYRRLTAPAVLGNLIALGDLEGYVHWLDRRDGRLVAQVEIAGASISARPLADSGRLYVYGDDGTIAALSAGAPPVPPRKPPPAPEATEEGQRGP